MFYIYFSCKKILLKKQESIRKTGFILFVQTKKSGKPVFFNESCFSPFLEKKQDFNQPGQSTLKTLTKMQIDWESSSLTVYLFSFGFCTGRVAPDSGMHSQFC